MTDLGLSTADLWDITLRDVYLLLDRWEQREARKDYRAGVIASITANVHRGKDSQALTPETFFPSLRADKRSRSTRRQGANQMLAVARRLAGGRVIKSKTGGWFASDSRSNRREH